MSLGLWLALVAVIVAVVGVAVTIFAARRWGNRRRKVLFSYDSTPLLPVSDERHLLEITYRDIPVKEPHLVTVRVANIGPSDIASQHFDAGRSLVVRLNCTMYGLTSNSHPHCTVSGAIGAEGVIELRPLLLHRGEEWVVEAVVQGDASPTIESPLIDTDVVDGPSAVKQLIEQLADVALTVTLPLGVQIQLKR
jgi:hypothetical protein